MGRRYGSRLSLVFIFGVPKVNYKIMSFDEDDVRQYNGVRLAVFSTPMCDYCYQFCNNDDDIYWCKHCCQHMCHLCYGERTSDDAIKNGSTNEKFAKRSQRTLPCITRHNIAHILEYDYVDFEVVKTYEFLNERGKIETSGWLLKNDKGNLCLGTYDDHSRIGVFEVAEPTITMETIEEMVQNSNQDYLEEKNWVRFYNTPFKQVMSKLNMPTHFG